MCPGRRMAWEFRGNFREVVNFWPPRKGLQGGLGIVGDNKRKYTQLVKTVYEIVYRLCNLLIFSVFCGAWDTTFLSTKENTLCHKSLIFKYIDKIGGNQWTNVYKNLVTF